MKAAILFLGVLLLLGSCAQPAGSSSTTTTVTKSEAALSLVPLQNSLPILSSGLKLALPTTNASSNTVSVSASSSVSRAITPANLVTSDGTSVTNQKPSTFYASLGGSGTATVRAPASGYYYDKNSNQTGNKYYFTLTPTTSVDANKGNAVYYRVKLYTYPLTDLSTQYIYEEYNILDIAMGDSDENGLWAWANRQADGTFGWITYYTVNADGTKTMRTVNKTSTHDGTYYSLDGAFFIAALPNPSANVTAYSYSLPKNPVAGTSNYSSQYDDVTTVNGSTLTNNIYHTEPTAGGVYEIIYQTNNLSAYGNFQRALTRSYNDLAGNQSYRGLIQTGTTWDAGNGTTGSTSWQFEVDKSDLSTASGVTTWTSRADIYYTTAASNIPSLTTPSQTTALVVTNTVAAATTYNGKMAVLWNGTGNLYTVKIWQDSSYNTYLSSSYAAAVTASTLSTALGSSSTTLSRSATSTPAQADVQIALSQLSGFSLALNGGTFTGSYNNGLYVGTYVKNGTSYAVEIGNGYVAVGGTIYHTGDLIQ